VPEPLQAGFDRALAIVLRHEGGKVDHPLDPGGRTAFGITQRTYDTFRSKRLLPQRDVFDIEAVEVEAIYRDWYWTTSGADDIDWPMSLVLFDTAVLFGPARAEAWLGLSSWLKDGPSRVAAFLTIRREFHRDRVTKRPDQARFLKGWLNRVDSLAIEAGLPVAA
jgi:hypothetical protein